MDSRDTFTGNATFVKQTSGPADDQVQETIVTFLIRNGLQDFVKGFVDEEVDMETLEGFTDEELLQFVPKIGFWSKLCTARRNHFHGCTPIPRTFPYLNVYEFLVGNRLDPGQYLAVFEEHGIGLEELSDLPDEMLKGIINKIGPWSKICKAKRALETPLLRSCMNLNDIFYKTKKDPLETFLQEIQVDKKFLQLFRDQELNYDDVMTLTKEELTSILGKVGPAHRIVTARRKLNSEKPFHNQPGMSSYHDMETEDDGTEEENGENEKKLVNILLLGETGVGKSTFINAFVN